MVTRTIKGRLWRERTSASRVEPRQSIFGWPRRAFQPGPETPFVWAVVVNFACYLVCFTAAIVLVGWIQGEPSLRAPIRGLGPMRWTVALSIVLLGVAILLRRIRRPGRVSEVIADGLALAAFAISAYSLLHSLAESLPVLHYLFFDKGEAAFAAAVAAMHRPQLNDTRVPWRMSAASGLGVMMLALAVMFMDRFRRLSTALLAVGIMLALAATCGYIFHARHLTGDRVVDPISLHTALSLLLLYGAAFAARPMREPMRSLFAPELGMEARMELLVGTWALPLLIGMAVRDGYARGWYEASLGFAIFAVAVIGLQTLLIWRSDFALTQMTRNKQRMEEVLRKNEKLAVAGRLAASISHEINNPLESISNLLYLIQTSSSIEEQHGYADLAAEELRRVSQITTQTLSFYRENTAPRMCDLGPILQSSVALLRGKISSMGVELVEDYQESLPAIVCSAGELRQVLVNLISNALDATPRGGKIVVRAALSRAWTRTGKGVVRILVSDTGSGMPPAVLARVFEPFYTTKEKTGNGLGLWVAADLVEKHGGWMKVKSRTWGKRRGTTFQLVLPVEAAA